MSIKQWRENRRRAKEIERDIASRRGKARIKQHIGKQKAMSKRLWDLGKQALRLGDQQQCRQILTQYLWTLDDIKRWERSLLSFEAIEARRDQSRATVEFLSSIQAMSQSLLASSSLQNMAEAQRDLEMGLARAKDMDERLSLLLDATDETVFMVDDLSDGDVDRRLREFEQAMGDEAEHEEGDLLDARIEEGLRSIEREMRKELK